MKPELSPDIVRRRITYLCPADDNEDLARERNVVQRNRKFGITVLIGMLITGFAAGGEALSIAAYNTATGYNLLSSSFYDRFTDGTADLLGDLLNHAVGEAAPPSPRAFERFRGVIAVDATIMSLYRFLSAFPAIHEGVSGI